jgi:hypothetical protein
METQPHQKMPIMPAKCPALPPSCFHGQAPKVSYISPYHLDKLRTQPHLQMILLSAMEAWLNSNPPDFLTYPSLYTNLIHGQTQIGWRQLLNGRITTKWSWLQDEYLLKQGLHNKKTTGQLWATSILSSIWEEWHLVWTIRNTVINGHDQTSRNCIQQTEAELEILAIYNNPDLLLPADQDHLFDDVKFHLTFSTTVFLSKTGLTLIKACLWTVSPKLRSARQKVSDPPFEAISIRYKRKTTWPRRL